MDIEKAIEIMKQHIQTCEENQKDKNIDFMIRKGFLSALNRYAFIEHEKEQVEAYKTVVQILEKSVGKKPFEGNQDRIFSSKIIGYICPICNEFVGKYNKVFEEMFERKNYCDCGQKIEWGDEQ